MSTRATTAAPQQASAATASAAATVARAPCGFGRTQSEEVEDRRHPLGERSGHRNHTSRPGGQPFGSTSFTHARARHRATADDGISNIAAVLRSPGETLDASTREFMEARFHHDFGRVRIHADGAAARAAADVDALAYTIGPHVGFAAGRYAPRPPLGRFLLAHELTHVVQQSRSARVSDLGSPAPGEADRAEHEANRTAAAALSAISADTIAITPQLLSLQRFSAYEFFANIPVIGFLVKALFEGTFSDEQLSEYLRGITRRNAIEDAIDSDNKARAIVLRWKASNPRFDLIARQKILLVQEMLSGSTGADDQNRILDLLELSKTGDLRQMFAGGGLSVRHLEEKLDGEEQKKRLQAFFTARFKGGRAAVASGTVEPQGAVKGAPRFPYSWAALEPKIDTYTLDELIEQVSAYDPADRDRALQDLAKERGELERKISDLNEQRHKTKDAKKKTQLEQTISRLASRQTTIDLILERAFKDIAVAETQTSLKAKTVEPTVAQKAEIRKALKPDVKADPSGHPLPFQSTLTGETKSYEDKLRDYMPTMIQGYYDTMVAGRGETEHKEKTKIHELTEFEEIGNASKDETDKVFGAYKVGPKLKADRPPTRGNIHDLFADTEEKLAQMTDDQRRDMARQLLFYFFQSDDKVRELNKKHNASPQFDNANQPLNDEAKVLTKLANEFTQTTVQVQRLNEIDRNWDASAGGGEINIQIFKKDTVDADRDFLWDMFQTLIHEYLHTLADQDYNTFAEGFGDTSNEFNTLVEGVDSVLTETVWSNVAGHVNDPALRLRVEGPTYSQLPPIHIEHPSRRRYASFSEAMKLVRIVGIRNLYAAYFLGDVKKIGA